MKLATIDTILQDMQRYIRGISLNNLEHLPNGIILQYKCSQYAFSDIGHIYTCFDNTLNRITNRIQTKTIMRKAEKINSKEVLMKIIIYEEK